MSIFLDKFAAPLNRFSTGSYDIVVFFIIIIQLDIVTRYAGPYTGGEVGVVSHPPHREAT